MLREADELACRVRLLLLAAASSSGSGPGPAGLIASLGIVVAGTLYDTSAMNCYLEQRHASLRPRPQACRKTRAGVTDVTYCSFALACGSLRETPLLLYISFLCCSNACPDGSLTATHDLSSDSQRAMPLFFFALPAVWLVSGLIFWLSTKCGKHMPDLRSAQATSGLSQKTSVLRRRMRLSCPVGNLVAASGSRFGIRTSLWPLQFDRF